ncbi:MAG: alpha/beta hydrolase [Desulfobacterales bacterium]|nr:alpha/beta hydrolase [Desulfobacterales bacterium]
MNWKSNEGLNIFGRGWELERTPRAVVCLVHGLGEHTGRYEHVGAVFTTAGYALSGFDRRGHGKSEGPRGHTPSYESLMDDIGNLLTQAGSNCVPSPFIPSI